jgi:hypothetical protein
MCAVADKSCLGGRLQGDLPQGADLHYGRHRKRSRHLCA